MWVHGERVVSAGRLVRATQASIIARVDEVTRGFSLAR